MNAANSPETFRHILLKQWAPALITALLGGLVVAGVVPFVNDTFERGRTLNERRTRLVEHMGESFAGMLANTKKVRALEGAINEDKQARERTPAGQKVAELTERIDRRRRELRETEITLYEVSQKVESGLWMARLLFGEETRKAIDGYKKWRESQGERPITTEDLVPHRELVMTTMVKEMGR